MIDIHAHILPTLDDGAQTMEDSLLLAKQAVAEGIHTMIATPHHKHPSYNNSKSEVEKQLALLTDELQKHSIPLKVVAGQEIRIYGELTDDLSKHTELLPLNETNYVLIEFPSSEIPKFADQLFYDIQVKGYTPIIAHPERNSELVKNPDRLYRFIKNGALSQITAGSLAGKFGKNIQKMSIKFLDHNLAHVIASDVHNLTTRNFQWKEAWRVVEKEFGRDGVDTFTSNATDIFNGIPIAKYPPERISQRKKLFGIV
ncbi:tyrosine-protein phosphatase [Paenisporosarcina indica]|uniref:tyrosine-protein phosphatase n=1 Tax=Paenisporosarcina indica TaxID=650093 RepID=UPI00094FEA9F|nr:CpsB/CapC family capsule biosynthesis tyrosine phosphatase [Paenisporosarcina indica]